MAAMESGPRSAQGEQAPEAQEPAPPRVEDYGGTALPAGRHGVILGGWRIESVKKPILNSPEIEKWDKALDAFRLPEMVFGHSSFELEHKESGTLISFNAFDGLKDWKAAKMPPVKIPAAAAWEARERASQEAILDYDYTFTTPYKGSLSSPGAPEGGPAPCPAAQWEESSSAEIDWDLLKRRDPILFSDEVILYEDELADSGIAKLTLRARVMPQCWFALLRFWLRVDGSLMRAYDTRLFCRLPPPNSAPAASSAPATSAAQTRVVREHCQREDTFAAMAAKGFPSESSEYKVPDTVVERLATRKHERSLLQIR